MMCALCNYLCICSSHSWQKMLLKIVILNGFISVLETRLVDLVRRQPIRGGLVSKTLPFPICLLTYASPIFYNTFFAFLAYYDMQCIHTKIGVFFYCDKRIFKCGFGIKSYVFSKLCSNMKRFQSENSFLQGLT